MQKILFVLLMISFLRTSGAQTQTFTDSADSLQSWVNLRVSNAKKGMKETVEMPLVVRSAGWGCMCPDHYIGVSTMTQEGPWISPLIQNKFPVSDSLGYSLIVRGYFTGKMKKLDLRNADGEPADWLYTLPEFQIISWKTNTKAYDADAPKVIGKRK